MDTDSVPNRRTRILFDAASRFAEADPDADALAAAGVSGVLADTGRANRAQIARLDPNGDKAGRVAAVNREIMQRTAEKYGAFPIGGTITADYIPSCEQDEERPFEEPESFDELTAIFREQAEALKNAGAAFIAARRMHSLAECRAALLGARSTGLPVIVTILADETGRTVSGATLASCTVALQSLGAHAVGIEGCGCSAEIADQYYRASVCARVPLIAVPLADGMSPEELARAVRPLTDAGASVLGVSGGGVDHLAALSVLEPRLREPDDADVCSNEGCVFFLCDDLTPSEPVECGFDLEDRIIDIEDERVNVIAVRVETVTDAENLADAAHLSRLPISVLADDPDILDTALRFFNGRALVDSRSELDDDVLAAIAAGYGALIY